MQRLFILILFFTTTYVFSQTNLSSVRLSGVNKFDQSSFSLSKKKDFSGSVFLFPDWETTGVIHTLDKGPIKINRLNFNIKQQLFQFELEGDSLFNLNLNKINKIVLNDRTFKKVLVDNSQNIYEVIYESDALSLFKGFSVSISEGSVDPMVNRKDNTYFKNETYYFFDNIKLSKTKLSKKRILEVISADKHNSVKTFAKQNKLSFKKDADVRKILSFSPNKI
jgi:hypothetical protein